MDNAQASEVIEVGTWVRLAKRLTHLVKTPDTRQFLDRLLGRVMEIDGPTCRVDWRENDFDISRYWALTCLVPYTPTEKEIAEWITKRLEQ